MTVAQIAVDDPSTTHSPHAPQPFQPPTEVEVLHSAESSRDLRLLRRVAARDEAAFADLFDRHAGLLTGLLSRMLGSTAEAEEVVQEVFLHVWKKTGSYVPERASPRGWLVVVARSRALDRIRARSARRRREEAAHAERLRGETDAAPLAHTRLEAQECRLRLRRALERVPSAQRRALELAFFEGLTHRELAARLAIPLGTAKSRILLGLRRLRVLLEADRSVSRHLREVPPAS